MELLQNDPVVSQITAAVFVPAGSGAPVHKDRKAHGLAFNVEHTTTYRFESGQVLTCHSGECIYLPQGSNYTVDRSERTSNPGAGVHAINFLVTAPLAATPSVMQVRGQDELLSAFTRAENAWRQGAVGFREECFSDIYRILKCLKADLSGYSQRDKVLGILAPALEYINANYTEQTVELSHLAGLCGVSQPYLRKLFHAAFRVPPAVYVRNKRLQYARELLQTGEYSVTDAATLAGFNDTAYFSREFKRATGLTPSQYAK